MAESAYKCDVCNKIFSTNWNLSRHMKIHARESLNCTFCPEIFDTKGSHTRHLEQHAGERDFKCKLCHKEFGKNYILTNHVKRTHYKKYKNKFECIFCDKLFEGYSNLEIHIRGHTHEKPFFCKLCSFGCSTKAVLARHIQIHNPERQKSFKCDHCTKRFFTYASLWKHKSTLDGKRFKCDLCGSDFNSNEIMKSHRKTHTDEKNHSCGICNKIFSRKANLFLHIQKHMGERIHQCDLCGKRFYTTCQVHQHMLSHFGERAFKCDVCQKDFKRKGDLKQHQKVHTSNMEVFR